MRAAIAYMPGRIPLSTPGAAPPLPPTSPLRAHRGLDVDHPTSPLVRSRAITLCAWLTGLLAFLTPLAARAADAQVLLEDRFDNLAAWRVLPSDGVKGSIHPDTGPDGSPALRLDFEFVRGGGYVIVQRDLPADLPENYEFSVQYRAAPGTLDNNLEFKLLDPTDLNVWWINRRAHRFPNTWQRLVNKKRHFEFAWGPAAGAPLTKLGKIEIVVASHNGGKSSLYLDDLVFRALPPTTPYTGTPVVTASSSSPDSTPAAILAADNQRPWRSGPIATDAPVTLTLDFGVAREFGGLSIHWDQELPTKLFAVETSDDGATWGPARREIWTAFDVNHVPLPDAQARYVRLALVPADTTRGVGVSHLAVRELSFASSPNDTFFALAAESPKGRYPRMWLRQQQYWTVVGVSGDPREGLLSEDGALELERRSASLEPFIHTDGQLLTWADGVTTHALADGYLPIPTVTRVAQGLELTITAFASGETGASTLHTVYRLTNQRPTPANGSLFLALRPFQVNPPWQFLNNPGGVAPTESLARDGSGVIINRDSPTPLRVNFTPEPTAFGAGRFDEGEVGSLLALGQLPPSESAHCPLGLASSAAQFAFELAPGESITVAANSPSTPAAKAPASLAEVEQRRAETHAYWVERLNRVRFTLPKSAARWWDVSRSTLAYVLINRDGPAIQPGSRAYERSWARDGSMTSAALLEFGLADEVKQWLTWFAPHQFENGKVPCVVDHRGPDPVPEHDSHGQLIMALANYHRYTLDRELLHRFWPNVRFAINYMDSLRGERSGPEFQEGTTATRQEPGKPAVTARAFFGLFPESISHEGYSAKPMHSYWDDLFGLRGYRDAAYIARTLNKPEASEEFEASLIQFRADFNRSVALAMQAHGIDYVPGCVELGDFDATSTTVAFWPTGEAEFMDQAALGRTFDRYWRWFEQRRDDPNMKWNEYTPYENRVIGAFVRLGQRDRALAAAEFFLRDLRPAAWNQWGEIVWRDPRNPRFVGDIPHTWVGSDFLNAFRALFIYDHERGTQNPPAPDELVLFAGVPAAWLVDAGPTGVGFEKAPTVNGPLTAHATLDGQTVRVKLEGAPRGPVAILVTNPMGLAASATVNGVAAKPDAQGRVRVVSLPATVEFGGK